MPVSFCAFEGCVHYICTNIEIESSDIINHFEDLRSRSRAFLKVSAIDRYATPMQGMCPRCSNRAPDHLQTVRDSKDGIADLRDWLQEIFGRYEHFGREYHKMNFSARAKSADLPPAALAHKQFQIESKPFGSDPFFQPAILCQMTLEDVEKKLISFAGDSETSMSIVKELDSARYNYSKFIQNMHRLNESWKIVKKTGENVPETPKPSKRPKTAVKQRQRRSRFAPTDKSEYIKRIVRRVEKNRWHARVENSCEREDPDEELNAMSLCLLIANNANA
ncbi:hypothetical protein LTR56_011191 [Elasticomyces elasticus]|nr:hypothetical protein LTR56_011191 [Elasticomyces elasticus]KAK4921823.1 hypothetical protein LTR49_010761 [Elasticomyces elasticus]KAK5753431.1 hypothetical protein LTS12_016482 [Elasticomyces elasticus]